MNLILKKFFKDPKNIGAIAESSESSAKKITSIINNTSTQKIIEIGGGTGSLSRFIINKDLTIVERDKEFVELLTNKYKGTKIIHNCGINFLKEFSGKYGLLTSIPLINKETKIELTKIINQHIDQDQLEWFIILGYKYFNQLKGIKFERHQRHIVLNNLPPAFIWHYY